MPSEVLYIFKQKEGEKVHNLRRCVRNLIKRDRIEITVVSDGKNTVDRIGSLAVREGVEVYPQLFKIKRDHFIPTDRVFYKFVIVNARLWCLAKQLERLDFSQVMDCAYRIGLVQPNLEATFLLCEYFVQVQDCPAPLAIFTENLNLIANGPDSVINIEADIKSTRIMSIDGFGQWGSGDYLAFLEAKAQVSRKTVFQVPSVRFASPMNRMPERPAVAVDSGRSVERVRSLTLV